MGQKKIALLSVFDKTGIVELAQALHEMGWLLLGSTGTAAAVAEAGIPITDIAKFVGPSILGHRVMTLSRRVSAGILSRDNDEDQAEMDEAGYERIDLVCVDMYPLLQKIAEGASFEEVIEATDIGGPTMLRAAAKADRIVMCDASDRERVVEWLRAGEPDRRDFLNELAAKAEGYCAAYGLASARYRSGGAIDGGVWTRFADCKGENDWQKPAGVYTAGTNDPLACDRLEQVAGSPASFNTWVEFDRLLQTMTHMVATLASPNAPAPPVALGSKHGSCCGAAVDAVPETAMGKMVIGHRKAIFGGHVMVNFRIGVLEARMLLTYEVERGQRLIDSIFAPQISDEALEMLRWRKGDRCRIFVNPALGRLDWTSLDQAPRNRYIRGGQLIQGNYTRVLDMNSAEVEGPDRRDPDLEFDLSVAWAIGSTSTSNTITLVRNGRLIGNGVGQFARVDAAELAIKHALANGHLPGGAVAYSDSFFPFKDGPEVLADAGIVAILTSSGSVRDQEIRDFCRHKGVALYMVPDAAGRGFFNH